MNRELESSGTYIYQVNDSLRRDLPINEKIYKNYKSEFKTIVQRYATTYPKSYAVTLAYELGRGIYKDYEYEMLLNGELKNNPYAQRFRIFFALKKGSILKPIVSDTNNVIHPISSILKRNTLIVIWFVGCAPCREELAYLEGVDQSTLPFDIITISTDTDKQRWKAFLKKIAWSKYNYLWNRNDAKRSGIYKYPTCILVDSNGVIQDPEFDAYSLKQR